MQEKQEYNKTWFTAAAKLALGYLVAAGGYIAFSSLWVERGSATVQDAARLEVLKGLGFVALTSAALWAFAYRSFRAQAHEAERRAASERALLESERRALAGTLSAAVAHDANNLLSILNANLSFLRSELPPHAEEHQVVEEARDAAMKLAGLMRRLRDTGKPAALAPLRLPQHVEEACALARLHPDGRGVQVDTEVVDVTVEADPTLLLQLVMNLVLNAVVQPRPAAGGRVLVRAVCEDAAAGVRVEVHDDGPGMTQPLDIRAYRTGRKDGTGLGLVSVQACVDALNGSLEMGRSAVLGGACFAVTLRTTGSAAPERTAARSGR